MTLLNTTHIKKTYKYIALIFVSILFNCIPLDFTEGINCDNESNIDSYASNFINYLNKSEGFFTIKEVNKNLIVEPLNFSYSYKENNIKLFYSKERNFFLVNYTSLNFSKFDSIIEKEIRRYLNKNNIDILNIDKEMYTNSNSLLIFEIENIYNVENKISKEQSLSSLIMLKKLNCLINKQRDKVSLVNYKKRYSDLDFKESEVIDNILPKLFYVYKSAVNDSNNGYLKKLDKQ